VSRLWAIFIVTAKRLLAQKGLAWATLLGLLSAVILVIAIPLYVDAVYYRLLREELLGGPLEGPLPPFELVFHYIGSWAGPVEWEEAQPLDGYLNASAAAELGLPQELLVRLYRTDLFRLFPKRAGDYTDLRAQLGSVSLGSITDLERHITLVEGRFPRPADPDPESPIEELISRELAEEVGLQVGETYIAFAPREPRNIQLPLRIAGIWQATAPEERFWFREPYTFKNILFVPAETLAERISPHQTGEIYEALWYLVLNADAIRTSDVGPLLSRLLRLEYRVASLLPKTSLVSPAVLLARYRDAANTLTILLFAASIPLVVLIVAFIGLVQGMVVARKRGEIAVMLSRGSTTAQIVGAAALEGLILGGLALALGLPLGRWVAQGMGRTRSFLNFTAPPRLQVALTPLVLRFGLGVVLLAVGAQVLTTLGASRQTIVTYERERARALRPPWWQRYGLDLLLLLPAFYGVYLLRRQGGLVWPLGGSASGDPFQNPLLFLVPSLGILALTLLALRLLPPLLAGLAWLVGHSRSVGLLLAGRQLARAPYTYATPLLLLSLTLSLAVFTASVARTMDDHLVARVRYQLGADIVISNAVETDQPSDEEAGDRTVTTLPRWFFFPASDYLQVPGVRAVAQVGQYRATPQLAGNKRAGTFMAVERVGFSQAAYWRSDLAAQDLGTLMNALATAPNAVLVPRSFLAENALGLGDTLHLDVEAFRQKVTLNLTIAGSFDLFPTWNPSGGPLFVGNLSYFFGQIGTELPTSIWLRADPQADLDRIHADLARLNPHMSSWSPPESLIAAEQERPERQGLFGLLSVGFLAAAVLTVAGLTLYTLFSFRRRFIELGILRAVGLSAGQLTTCLFWELALLMTVGVALGTGLGIWASHIFIPYLQIEGDAAARVPPFYVQIAWPAVLRIYGLFALTLASLLSGLLVAIRRLKIFQAVKLGYTP